ncbi:MAG: hypothetical protein EXR43_03945 [Dehalococcoidia bacterium]|nr:hypothetical protein [Dehalococcoidia bacterium]
MDEEVTQDPQEVEARDGSFELSYPKGRAVFLRVSPPVQGGAAVELAGVLTAMRSTPLERFLSDYIAGIVRDAKDPAGRHR